MVFVADHCIKTKTAAVNCRLRTGDEIETEGKPRINCMRQTTDFLSADRVIKFSTSDIAFLVC